MTGEWQDMSTAPRDGTVLTLSVAGEPRSAVWDKEMGAWFVATNRCWLDGDAPSAWRPLGGTP